ncbi:hypothetical protein Gohar_018392 [Gossypium harknessii]|uniref:RNase H type-1 domain-containing protein n=1 Tax=Gossypium harknessii TaxID=34285 RepID=A0A7J9GB35_9ROSI|nr:hypothetical protein [Gossypium harknessii]
MKEMRLQVLPVNQRRRTAMIQSNSLEVVKVIQDRSLEASSFALLKRTKQFLKHESRWFIRHVPREENHIFNYLARMIFDWKEGL